MNKSKIIITLMSILLIASIGTNIYFTGFMTASNSGDTTKVAMFSTLSQLQVKINSELQQIGSSLAVASEKLTYTGLTGIQADAVLSALVANSTFIINAATLDMNNIMVAIQPPAYNEAIGTNIGKMTWLNPNPNGAISPMMTPLILLVDNSTGVVMVAPVFNTNREKIGVVSAAFNPQELVSACIAQIPDNAKYEFTAMQTDGVVMFDSEGWYLYKNLLTDSTVKDYNIIHASVSEVANNVSGYYLYDYSGTNWQLYWTTLSAFGQDWRLVIHHIA